MSACRALPVPVVAMRDVDAMHVALEHVGSMHAGSMHVASICIAPIRSTQPRRQPACVLPATDSVARGMPA